MDTSNYYDKAESDGRFLGKSAQAVDSDKLGGLNADAFRREGDGAGGDLSATYPNPIIAASAIGSAEVADGSLRLSDLAAFDVWQNAPPREFGAHTCDTEPYGVGGFGGRAGDLVLVVPDGAPAGVIMLGGVAYDEPAARFPRNLESAWSHHLQHDGRTDRLVNRGMDLPHDRPPVRAVTERGMARDRQRPTPTSSAAPFSTGP